MSCTPLSLLLVFLTRQVVHHSESTLFRQNAELTTVLDRVGIAEHESEVHFSIGATEVSKGRVQV